uniref:Uncharacterized protein TCIL3000_8_2430 n=1 Tax=Trypanosoma congolense (strain IL3000) TaxID=1068625 RepID=G0URL2_TRYCI|nr:unnamed protein product [Trypanosoma congolense IL3000]
MVSSAPKGSHYKMNEGILSSATAYGQTTALEYAFQAHWDITQEIPGCDHMAPANGEKSLLRVLRVVPEQARETLADVIAVLPYLLAFAMMPEPTEYTQLVALESLRETIDSVGAAWKKEVYVAFVYDIVVMKYHALHALQEALCVALEDADCQAVCKSEVGDDTVRDRAQRGSLTDMRRAIVYNILELVLTITVASKGAAREALECPQLSQRLAEYLLLATPQQACKVVDFFHNLCDVDGGEKQLIRHEIFSDLAAYVYKNACSTFEDNINTSVRSQHELTALCGCLRLVVQLSKVPEGFTFVHQNPMVPTVLAEVLQSPWSKVLELGCLWLAVLVESHMPRSSKLVADLVSRTGVGNSLAGMVLWWSSNVTGCAAAAARCWRHMALANPPAVAGLLASNTTCLSVLLQTSVTAPHTFCNALCAKGVCRFHGGEVRQQLVDDIVCALGICYGLAPKEVQLSIRSAILTRLSPAALFTTLQSLNDSVVSMENSHFAQHPAIEQVLTGYWEGDTECDVTDSTCPANKIENENDTRSDTSTDDVTDLHKDVVSDEDSTMHLKGERWRSFVLDSVRHMCSGAARGTTEIASIVSQHERRAWTSKAFLLRNVQDTPTLNLKRHRGRVKVPVADDSPVPLPLPVVERAKQMGEQLYLESVRVVLSLSRHYKQLESTMRYQNVKGNDAHSLRRTSVENISCKYSSSHRVNKLNPWTRPKKVRPLQQWSIHLLHCTDIILFCTAPGTLHADISQAIGAVDEHMKYLFRFLRTRPTCERQRRCLINDLYTNVYPTVCKALKFIGHYATYSDLAQKVIVSSERGIHSGNIMEVCKAVELVVGVELLRWDPTSGKSPKL